MKRGLLWALIALGVIVAAVALFRPDAEAPNGPEQVEFRRQADPREANREQAETADRAASVAAGVDGVARAWALVAEEVAYIGLQLEPGAEGNRAEEIERNVAREVDDAIETVRQVLVSSDPDVASRIREMSEGVAQGRPLSEFRDELDEITKRMQPNTR